MSTVDCMEHRSNSPLVIEHIFVVLIFSLAHGEERRIAKLMPGLSKCSGHLLPIAIQIFIKTH